MRRLAPFCFALSFSVAAVAAAPPAAPATPTTTTTAATAPTQEEKLQALAILVRLHDSKPAGSPVQKTLGMAISMVVFEMAGVDAAGSGVPTPEQQQAVQGVVALLKKQGVDAQPALKSTLQQFEAFACRSKQSEAKGNLKALYVAEESHRAEFDTYDKDAKKIGFEARGQTLRYRYEVVQATASTFSARATGIGEMKGDVWEITQDNSLVNVTNGCAVP